MLRTTELHVRIDDLQPGTEYEFAVRVHIDAWSDWSMSAFNKTKPDETATPTTPISPPTDVKTLVSPFSILVTWSDPSVGLDQPVTGEFLYCGKPFESASYPYESSHMATITGQVRDRP